MKIWTRIGGSCLGFLQTKTMSTLTSKKNHCQLLTKEINKFCCDQADNHPAFVRGLPQHRMIVCYDRLNHRYDRFQQIPFDDFSREGLTDNDWLQVWSEDLDMLLKKLPGSPAD
jgi:hypothetical protein